MYLTPRTVSYALCISAGMCCVYSFVHEVPSGRRCDHTNNNKNKQPVENERQVTESNLKITRRRQKILIVSGARWIRPTQLAGRANWCNNRRRCFVSVVQQEGGGVVVDVCFLCQVSGCEPLSGPSIFFCVRRVDTASRS